MNPQAPRQPDSSDDQPQDALRASFSDLSALSDGEADADGLRSACDAWRDDAQARRTWHAYQLIGDVLRSDELASSPAHDAAFLATLRTRLRQEPVVLAPQPLPVPVSAAGLRRHQRWLAPAAVAAGFVAVAGVLVVTRMGAPDAAAQRAVMASSGASAPNTPNAPNFTLTMGPGVVTTSPQGAAMLRDAELDAYLNAHQASRRIGAMALPGSALRSVEVVLPADRQP